MAGTYQFEKISLGGGGTVLNCPFDITVAEGDTPEEAADSFNRFNVTYGMVNNVLVDVGVGTGTKYVISSSTDLIVLSIDVTNVSVQSALVYQTTISALPSPPSPQENFPVNNIIVPLYRFDDTLNPIRLFGCSNVSVWSYVAFTINKTLTEDNINDYPYTNFWNWAVLC